MGDILVVTEHLNNALTDITFELLASARKLATDSGGGNCTALLIGGSTEMHPQLGAADALLTIEADANFNPQTHAAALRAAVEAKQPQVVLVGNTAMGMDLAATVATQTERPLAAYCLSIEAAAGALKATSQLYGGKMNVTTDLGNAPCVIAMLSGAAPADEGRVEGQPALETMGMPDTPGTVRFKRLLLPEAGDVDITTQEVLVAVGRGIGKKEDIEVAEELAKALNAELAASRPIIDAGWLPKSRQVGKSGQKVKPKVYLALGISGAPEHIEGMRDSATIIAINSDKNAPIFDVAHYGLVGDLFDVCEELMDEL